MNNALESMGYYIGHIIQIMGAGLKIKNNFSLD